MSELPQTTHRTARRIRRRWFVAAAIGLFVLPVVFHAPLLRGVANFLVVEQVVVATQPGRDLVILNNDAERMAAAALIYRQGNYDRILLIPNRLQRIDALQRMPSSIEQATTELAGRGIPGDRIIIVGARSSGLTNRVREACNIARSQPERTTTLMVSAFEGAAVQRLVDRELADDGSVGMALTSMDPTQFDRQRWWTSRIGTQAVFRGYLTWLLVLCRGDEPFASRSIDWQAFEAAVARGEKP